MAQIGIGQRVQVIDGGLTEYQQLGTVVAAGPSDSWFVHLDASPLDVQTFFQVEELLVVAAASAPSSVVQLATAEDTM